jgi:hypothetical protein
MHELLGPLHRALQQATLTLDTSTITTTLTCRTAIGCGFYRLFAATIVHFRVKLLQHLSVVISASEGIQPLRLSGLLWFLTTAVTLTSSFATTSTSCSWLVTLIITVFITLCT